MSLGSLLRSRFARSVGLIVWSALPATGGAADSYLHGKITNITTTSSGLMIMLDAGMPTNCSGSPYGWMLIPEQNKTMVATTLLLWTSGQRAVTVYTNALTPGTMCTINQMDPD